ncbi:winged helix-turn-helix domain-containing protein [uncultured Brevundimonas sp.]|uniref:winged helix-turn-helix domain-containing protein n=1 Tax=uncultured Brevundimonas sp. TaxID=213418 RepID=UPI0025E0AB50|nr:winged helix-turn-helix domain-containing protein [uncultured Brevundimonas sp.]
MDTNVKGADDEGAARDPSIGAGILPNALRRPVNAISIAMSLGVPRESARTKLAGLVERGVLVRTDGGFVLRAEVSQSKPFKSAMEAFLLATVEFVDGLAMLNACGARDGDRVVTPAWPVAGLATRLMTAHVLKGIQHARSLKPEISLTTHYVLLWLSHLTGSALRVVQEPDAGRLDPLNPPFGPVSVIEVAKAARMDDETVRRHLGQLERAGLVIRVAGKRDINLPDQTLVANWLDFQSRTILGTQQLVRKLYVAGVIVDRPSETIRLF